MIVYLVDGRVKGFARSGCTRVVPTFASQMSIVRHDPVSHTEVLWRTVEFAARLSNESDRRTGWGMMFSCLSAGTRY